MLRILVIGQTAREEARSLQEWIKDTLRPAELLEFADLESVTSLSLPDLVIVFQSWSDEFPSGQIDRIAQMAPLARWVVCYGAWCESDGRNRDIWPLAIRVPMRSARSRILQEWRLLHGDATSVMPMSASREEIFANDHSQDFGPVDPDFTDGSSVTIVSPDPEFRKYLGELLAAKSAGGQDSQSLGCHTWVIDIDPWSEEQLRRVEQIKLKAPHDGIICLTNLLENSDLAELRALPVTILPKLGDQFSIVQALGLPGQYDSGTRRLA